VICLLGISPRLLWTKVISVPAGSVGREVGVGIVGEEVLAGRRRVEVGNFINLPPIPDLIPRQVHPHLTFMTK
jgi:hypothetical protein